MPVVTHKLALIYEGLRAADTLVAKALGVSEQAQSARIEVQLRRFITTEWKRLAAQATKTAAGSLRNGPGDTVRAGDVDKALAIIDRTMAQWAPRVTPQFTRDMREIYMLGRKSGLDKALGTEKKSLEYNRPPTPDSNIEKAKNLVAYVNPSFDLVDKQAVEALNAHQVFWIGHYYEDYVSEEIAANAKVQIQEGMGRVAAGKKMQYMADQYLSDVFVSPGYHSSTENYFQGLVANASTIARTTGRLRSFEKVGFSKYIVVNPGDHRTCPICNLMDGKEFRVADGRAQAASTQQAVNPLKVKQLHPWFTPKSANKMIGKAGPATADQTGHLAKAGHSLPTYHYHCRCDIDVSPDSEVLTFETDIGAGVKPPKPTFNPASVMPKAKQMKPKKAPKVKAPPKAPTKPPAPGQAAQMAEVGPGTSEAVNAAEFPWQASELQELPDLRLGGAHRKYYFQAPDGSRWMFKPAAEEFRAYGDEVSAKLADRLGVPTAQVHVVKIGGRTGSMQKLVDDVLFDLKSGDGIKIEVLRDYQLGQVQREHAFDWLIGNHDGHGGNLLARGPRGNLLGIDKGQCFKFYDQDSIAFTYNPNIDFGEVSYYNQQFERYAKGLTQEGFVLDDLASKELQDFLKAVDEMPDEDFLALIKPYSSRVADAKQGAFRRWNEQQFLDAALRRKRDLRKTVEHFYTNLNEQRRRALGIIEEVAEEAPAAAIKVHTPINKSLIQKADKSGWAGRAVYVGGEDYEGMEFLLYGSNKSTYFEAKLRTPGHNKLMTYLQRATGSESEYIDPNWADFERYVKSINYHLGAGGDGVLPDHTVELGQQLWAKFARTKLTDVAAEQKGAFKYYREHVGQLINQNGTPKSTKIGTVYTQYKPKPAAKPTGQPPIEVRRLTSFAEGEKKLIDGKILEERGEGNTFYGEVYEMDLGPGAKGYYIRHGDNNLFSKQGRLRIRYEKPLSEMEPKEITTVMKKLERIGLNGKLATAEDLEYMYLIKVTRGAGLEGRKAFTPDAGATVAQNVKKLKTAWEDRLGYKLTKAKGYQPTPEGHFPDGSGMGHFMRFDIDVDELMKADVGVYHHLYHGIDDLEKTLGNKSKGLIATENKFRLGILPSGMSPGRDQETGGASFAFTRLRSIFNEADDAQLRLHTSILRDPDALTFNRDAFGECNEAFLNANRKFGQDSMIEIAQHGAYTNETDFKNGISFEKWLDEVKVRTQSKRKEVIKWFKDAGIKRVGPNQKRIEDVVIVDDSFTPMK